jgi:two-component system nitrate/nitrite response regulator NarL
MDGAGETRVLIVGEDPLARGGLAVLLAGEAGLLVVGQTAPGPQTAAAMSEMTGLQPDAVVWDLGVSPRGVPEGLGSLPAVVALVADEEVAAEALAAGARGMLPREAGPARIAAALRAVARGLVVLDDDLAAALLRPRPPAVSALVEPLTSRELEVRQVPRQLHRRQAGRQRPHRRRGARRPPRPVGALTPPPLLSARPPPAASADVRRPVGR